MSNIFHVKPMLYDVMAIKGWDTGVLEKQISKTRGLGHIDKILESTITENGEEYTLEFVVDELCSVLNDLKKMNIILANGQLFRIKEVKYSSEDRQKEVFARHISHDFEFDAKGVKEKKYEKKTFQYIIEDMIKNYSQFKSQFNRSYKLGRFAKHNIDYDWGDNSLEEQIQSVIDKFIESVAEEGHEIFIEIVRDNYDISFFIFEDNKDYSNSQYRDSKGSGRDTGIRLDYKKIKNLEITENFEDFCTAVDVKGKDDLIAGFVTHPTIGNGGYPFWVKKTISNTDLTSASALQKFGKAYIQKNSLTVKNIKAELNELPISLQEILKDLKLYDKVLIKHNMLNDVFISFRIVETTRDIDGNLVNIELGEKNSDFAKSMKKAISRTSLEVVTKVIKGMNITTM